MINSAMVIRSIVARAVVAPINRPIRTAAGVIPAALLALLDSHAEQGITGHAYSLGAITNFSPISLIAADIRLPEDTGLIGARCLRCQRMLPLFERPPPLPSLNWRMPLTALHLAIQARAFSLSAADVARVNLCAAELIRCIA